MRYKNVSLTSAVFLLAFIFSGQHVVRAQTSDVEKFAEGRVALEKYKDCPTALDSLQSVSSEGQKNLLWVYYMAKTYECLNRLDDAIKYYMQYDEMKSGQPAVAEKLADLRYLAKKRAAEEAAAEAKRNDFSGISGVWSESDGKKRVRIQCCDYNRLTAYAVGEKDDSPYRDGELRFEAKIIGGKVTFGNSVARFNRRTREIAAEKCPNMQIDDEYPVLSVEITISPDQNTITVKRNDLPQIDFDICKVRRNFSVLETFSRMP